MYELNGNRYGKNFYTVLGISQTSEERKIYTRINMIRRQIKQPKGCRACRTLAIANSDLDLIYQILTTSKSRQAYDSYVQQHAPFHAYTPNATYVCIFSNSWLFIVYITGYYYSVLLATCNQQSEAFE